MRILILANARYKGGLSGGDAIYQSFIKFWPCSVTESTIVEIDYCPFWACYLHRIVLACFRAICDRRTYDLVYSSSDFLADSIPSVIYRLKGVRWIAGFYLSAFRENRFHFYSQKVVKWLINKLADMVIVTNPTMYVVFPNKNKTWINGGINLKLAGISIERKVYDAVFCGRIHPSKGIDELIEIWKLVRDKKKDARLALIGDGDLGLNYVRNKIKMTFGVGKPHGIELFGYMGDERFEIYKKSRVVVYPTPEKYDHFSMAPVEAMACGCLLVTFSTPVQNKMNPWMAFFALDIKDFAQGILSTRGLIHESVIWARQFDYEKQALRVFQDIRKELYENSCNGK